MGSRNKKVWEALVQINLHKTVCNVYTRDYTTVVKKNLTRLDIFSSGFKQVRKWQDPSSYHW